MSLEEIIYVLRTEQKCVERQDTPQCDHNCKECDLCLPTGMVRQAYQQSIFCLDHIRQFIYWENDYESTLNAKWGEVYGKTIVDKLEEMKTDIKDSSFSMTCFDSDAYAPKDRAVDMDDVNSIIDDYIDELKGACER